MFKVSSFKGHSQIMVKPSPGKCPLGGLIQNCQCPFLAPTAPTLIHPGKVFKIFQLQRGFLKRSGRRRWIRAGEKETLRRKVVLLNLMVLVK